MASDKRNKRDDRGRQGTPDPRRRRAGLPWAEELENRRLLASAGTVWHATTTDPYDAQNGPLANLGAVLVDIYKSYNTQLALNPKAAYQPVFANTVQFRGNAVGVDVRGTGSITDLQKALQSLGMFLSAASPNSSLLEGFIPIAKLPALATNAQVRSASPMLIPYTKAAPNAYPFQGIGNNQSANTLNVPLNVQAGVPNGTGQKVGVLSDSVSQSGGGLADSVRSGDLPSNVQVLQDGTAGGSDEGRAMLEQIHDIAPGAQLGFATAGLGEQSFANNIVALAQNGYSTIVDDIGYSDEPAFQDGIISQGVNTATALGATYLSAAGNTSDDGYLSTFRGVNTTVGSLGAGRYMNFDPTGATQTTQLGLYVPDNLQNESFPPSLNFQFDQPVGNVTSNITAYLLDSSGNIAYQGVSDPFADGVAFQALVNTAGTSTDLLPGNYTLVIKVVSGPDPGHVFAYNLSDGDLAFNKSFGTAGGTSYTTTFGHSAAANTIGVGAVPYYGAAPYPSTTTNNNEPFSSFGPVISVFNPDGSPMATPQTLLKPDLSGPDGNNTSFFGDPPGIPTTIQRSPVNPSFPGNAPTTVGDPTTAINYNQNLENFYGTSSAAPNVAAVVALMKQANPSATKPQILNDLIASTIPLNGAAKGTWNAQGGYGLVDATAAINAVSVLQVNSVTPGNNATITQAPNGLTVNFSKPVVLSSLNSGSISVYAPAGFASVLIGQPVGLDSTTTPTSVFFPITILPVPGRVANGIYGVVVPAGITAADGTKLANNFVSFFNLQQTTAPQVTATGFVGRVITIAFSEPLNPSTVNSGSIVLIRANGVGNPLGASSVLINASMGAVTTYNPFNNTVTIDLTRVPQSALPTDHYGLIVSSAVTDAVGNPLNGAFNGTFPSGTFPATSASFVQDLGVIAVQAPVISSFVLSPTTDTGTQGDSDTAIGTPSFVGQVNAVFPATNAGLAVYVQFNGINHPGLALGGLNLGPGAGGRGVVGQYDAVAITDAFGRFVINYPAGVTPLPEGQNLIRAVVVGATDAAPAGLSGVANATFQIDRTRPFVGTLNGTSPTSVPENGFINNLTSLTISVVDPVNPTSRTSPFAVSTQSSTPALDASGANNLANYKLYLFQVNPANGAVTAIDESNFLKSATFVSTSARVLTSDPYTGQIILTFGAGLPMGRYGLFVVGSGQNPSISGVSDAVGNGLTNSATASATGANLPFILDFNLQPTPTYITSYQAYSADSSGNAFGQTSGPRASYEIPAAGTVPGALAPPTGFTIDFSNTLAAANYANDIELVRSANTVNGVVSIPDGDFGTLGQVNVNGTSLNPSGYTIVPSANYTVQLVSQIAGTVAGQPGFMNRLFISLKPGITFAPDYYRVYLPNTGSSAISDINGNQLDGEFLGYQNASGKYVDQLNDGTVRGSGTFDAPDLSGDGVAGGAFMTGFVVVPNGNVIYARADNIYNPQLPGNYPDGSQANPYPVLAPEASYNSLNGGDLNSSVNAGVNFNATYDRAGLGMFEPSAFFAAQEKVRLTQAPAVIVAQASLFTRDPFSGAITQRPFVLQAPSGYKQGDDPTAFDASAAVPAMTTLILAAGSTLKMQNAALLVQNQGSALQVLGGPNSYQTVTVTSYKDSSVGGVTNGDPTSVPAPGDYGGILLRNFNQAGTNSAGRTTLFPGQIPITGSTASDDRLKGPFTNRNDRTSQLDAVSGADSIMSSINYLVEKYAGGTVPQTYGVAYDGIELQNSRPAITNSTISFASASSTNPSGANVAGLSVDVDSLLQDDVASGPLLRGDIFFNNGLNGIYVRAQQASGVTEPTNATNLTGNTFFGSGRSYVFDDPYPYIFASQLQVGSRLAVETGGGQINTNDRVYVEPGMILKFSQGANINVASQASINVGDATYIKEFDSGTANPNLAGFRANSALLSNAIFTSEYDDAATSTYTDPNTGAVRTVVPALPAVLGGAGTLQPTATNVPAAARWGGIFIASGAVGVLNSTIFRYGGGSINIPRGTSSEHVVELGGGFNDGAHVSITNNTFVGNLDVPINMQPDSLLAGDATQPLASGDPFIHGNVFTQNGLNGVGVQGGVVNEGTSFAGENLDHDSIWTGSDFTYILRNTIVLGPAGQGGAFPGPPPSSGFIAEPKASVTLTLQSTLPNTLLADGTRVAAPGLPLIVKVKSAPGTSPPAEAAGANPGQNVAASSQGGAGFIAGVDNGQDPSGDSLVDNGVNSQIRILGIQGDSSTGQARVPVIITSLYDNTVGTTVNGVSLNQAVTNPTQNGPQPGDGGVIYFGGNSLTTYNLQDPRSGSIIDNADIKYMTRIEQQGGGIINLPTSTATTGTIAPSYYDIRAGLAPDGNTSTQYNSPKKLTISNSNLSSFSDGGVFAHAGFNEFINSNGIIARTTLGTTNGEPTQLYIVNTTIANMLQNRGTGVEIVSEIGGAATAPAPSEAVILNSTFYNNQVGINIVGDTPKPDTRLGHVALLAMDNIFAYQQSTTSHVIQGAVGTQVYGSDSQFNLFYGNKGPVSTILDPTTNSGSSVGGGINNIAAGIQDSQPIYGDPMFRAAPNPANITGNIYTYPLNFNLLPGSAAIDRARSQLGPSIFGDMLWPAATIDPNNLNGVPIRNNIGDTNTSGGLNVGSGFFTNPAIVTQPGEPVASRLFPDQWTATTIAVGLNAVVPANTANAATPGTVGNSFYSNGTYPYTPLTGVRDILGNLRQKVTSANTGFGSDIGYDLGALEFEVQNPPKVTSIVAVAANSAAVSNLYVPNSIAGINQYPGQIRVGINERLNPSTINSSSVVLVGSGGDGVFGNANDISYNLAGRLSFDTTTDTLIINTAGLFPTSALNDEYQLTLRGTGAAILRDNNGNALDGYTNNNTLPLPSGSDNFPGTDFAVQFTVDTNPPSLVAGSFGLAPGSFQLSAAAGAAATVPLVNTKTPTFVGKVSDIFPPANPLAGDKVYIDVSSTGDPNNFDLLNAGTGTTDGSGNFSVTLTTPLPNSNLNVGPDGKEGTADDTGGLLARVRIVDQAGNVSILPSAPLSQYLATGAAVGFEVDTIPPAVYSLTPTSTSMASLNSDGTITVTAVFTKNINPTTLNANSVLVYRSGGSGTFTGLGTPVPINSGSFQLTYLNTPSGAVQVQFTIPANQPNDLYRIVLKGTGSNPIRDVAGNALDGLGNHVAGSGDYTNGTFTIFSAANSRLLYVSNQTATGVNTGSGTVTTGSGALGSRENPYPTIAAGLAAANIGDYVLVLPGTYRENVVLKGQVKLESADPSSTDTAFTPGNALSTIIYGNTSTASPTFNTTTGIATVFASNLPTIAGLDTEISGFTILNPLIGDNVRGTIDPTSAGITLYNSNVLVDKNYIVNAGVGINVGTTGANAVASRIYSNVIAGNIAGIGINDTNSTTSYASPVQVFNNTIADNTFGVIELDSQPNVLAGYIFNDIFYNNHDLTAFRTGTGIFSTAANTLAVGSNLFYGNGVSGAPSSNATGVFTNFNPAFLKSTPDGAGNILGDPAFVSPRDPRPDGDTAPVFFNYANYDLTSRSPAINSALNVIAPNLDILYRKAVPIAGKGFPGTGPASIGAFYYLGTGGASTVVVTGQTPTTTTTTTTTPTTGTAANIHALAFKSNFSLPIGTQKLTVVGTSLDPDGTTSGVGGAPAQSIAAPTEIDVTFSDDIDPTSISASDLVLTGSGLDASNPAHAVSLNWVDDHTIRFLLAGGFNPNGTVNVSIPAGAVKDTAGVAIDAYAESFKLGTADATTGTAVVAATSVAIPVQPVAVAGPVAVHYGKGHKAHSAKAHAVATAAAHKKEVAAKAKAAAHAKPQAKAEAKSKAHAQAHAKAHAKMQAKAHHNQGESKHGK